MTLHRIKIVAVLTPVVVIAALELARLFVIGAVSWQQRLTLDAIVAVAFVIFALLIFRFIGPIQARLARQNQELLALHGAGLDVASELSLDILLKKVVDQARQLVGSKYGALSVIDAQGRIESFVTSGISDEERAAIGPPPVGHGVLGVVLEEGQHLRLEDVSKHPRSIGFPPHHPAMRSLLAVPIALKEPWRGTLYLADKTSGDGSFSPDDEQTLERFAVQVAIAIANAFLHSQAADFAVAQERLRIAHEMHDGLAQVLGYVNTKVQAAEGFLQRGRATDASQQLEELARSARDAYVDVRESIIGLRTLPGSDRTLQEALEEFVARWKEQSGVEVAVDIEPALRLRPAVELQLIRIIQESLTNVRKHARAAHAWVSMRLVDGVLSVTIRDDGAGFDEAARTRSEFPRFGLTTMRERAESVGGRLNIASTPGAGTTVTFELPAR